MALKYGLLGDPGAGVDGATEGGKPGARAQEPLQEQSGTWIWEGGHQAEQHRPREGAGVKVNPGRRLKFQGLGLSLLYPQAALGPLPDMVGRTWAGLGCQSPPGGQGKGPGRWLCPWNHAASSPPPRR